jgi:hypothetical protein
MTLYNQKKCSFFIRKHVEESKKRGVLAENPPWSVLVAILYCPSEMTAPLGGEVRCSGVSGGFV